MMKNNNSIQKPKSQDFETLLESFLAAQADEKDAGTFSYKGCTYVVPGHERSEKECRFSGLRFSLGARSFTPEKGEPARFFIDGQVGKSERFSLYMELTDCGDGDDCCPTAFYVYREGEPRPLAYHVGGQITGFYSQNDFTTLESPLTPGYYFLLADGLVDDNEPPVFETLDDHLCLPFVVMESGEKLAHPVVLSACASRSKNTLEDGPWTSGMLRLKLSLSAPMQAGHELSAICYTEDWRQMAHDERLQAANKRREQTLQLHFRSDLIWMPGRYTVILSHNSEPFASATFDYRGEADMPCVCRTLEAEDAETLLAKSLATHLAWKNTRDFSGMTRLRLQLAALLSKSGYNSFCREQQLAELCENIYAAVSADVLFHARRLAYCLPRMLNYCTTETRQVDCKAWVAEDNPDALMDERTSHAMTLYNIGVLCSAEGRACLTALEEAVEDSFTFWALTLCGTEEELQRLFASSPVLDRHVRPGYRFRVEAPLVSDTLHALQRAIGETAFRLDAAAENELARQVMQCHDAVSSWSKDERLSYVMRGLVGRVKQRIREQYDATRKPTRKELVTIKAEDIALADWIQTLTKASDASDSIDEQAFAESMKELETMVGLRALKETLSTTFCRVRFEERRRRMGLPVAEETAGHIIFTGNPGTGKTTVARLLGRIYRALGLLSKGEVISTERRELVGEYIGQTEEKMNAVLRRARGNVLFIDEAYSLCTDSDDRRDYGRHVVESLLPVLTEPHPDMVVILAGYDDEMERLLQSNPGLKGRFPYKFRFDDYTADELMQIAGHTLERGGYRLTPEARELLRGAVEDAVKHKDRFFANARWVNRFVTAGILPAMARRVMAADATANDVELYSTVERADVAEAIRLQASASAAQSRPRIGFKA